MTGSGKLDRRELITFGVGGAVALSTMASGQVRASVPDAASSLETPGEKPGITFPHAERIAFPLGGMGAGMFCLEGNGGFSSFSLCHRPDLANRRLMFGTIAFPGRPELARVIEGPVPRWKLAPRFPNAGQQDTSTDTNWGLPRFAEASFNAAFPFATVCLEEAAVPVQIEMTGWSPFIPGDADNSSLPVAAVEYRISNSGAKTIDAAFSFHCENIFSPRTDAFSGPSGAIDQVLPLAGGFILKSSGPARRPADAGSFAVWTDAQGESVAWRDGSVQTLLWDDIVSAGQVKRPIADNGSAPGASISIPLTLGPGEKRMIVIRMAWHVPGSTLFAPTHRFDNGAIVNATPPAETYRPWYAGRFGGVADIVQSWSAHYAALRASSGRFSRSLHASTIPPEALEAVARNLTILKSPTVLRQADGRFWAWEGSYDDIGSCYGNSTHVWNYAQALAHLFPDLERTVRESEYHEGQEADGRQYCRVPLPIAPSRPLPGEPVPYIAPPAADGQLGGILKAYRDWRISGDTSWLRGLWPKVRASLDYCIRTWDPRERGWLEEPHVNTYDIEFWGPDGLHSSLYLGALRAAMLMAEALGETGSRYRRLFDQGRKRMETELFNGEYFYQKVMWTGLDAHLPRPEPFTGVVASEGAAAAAIGVKEGPHNQYGPGCLSDGVFGLWLSHACGLGDLIDAEKVASHLKAVHRYNFKPSFAAEATFNRTFFASGDEPGLVLCSWPRGGRPSLPFEYASEVWTGIEYQVAAHLIATGNVKEGLEIVGAVRRRYNGETRNPFDEVEAGHWYGRALASYGLLQALSGARYDAVECILYLSPALTGDFQCFLATASGFGLVGVSDGAPFLNVVEGTILARHIAYLPFQSA